MFLPICAWADSAECGFAVQRERHFCLLSPGRGADNPTHAAGFYRLFSLQMPLRSAVLWDEKGLFALVAPANAAFFPLKRLVLLLGLPLSARFEPEKDPDQRLLHPAPLHTGTAQSPGSPRNTAALCR